MTEKMRFIFSLCVYVHTYPVNQNRYNTQYEQGNGSHLI